MKELHAAYSQRGVNRLGLRPNLASLGVNSKYPTSILTPFVPFVWGSPTPQGIYFFQRSYKICAVHTKRNINNNDRGENKLANRVQVK